MAARAKRPAAVGAARPPVAGEGGGWLCRVYGRSPAEGDLAVYALLPRLPAPGSLGRLATVLSGDPRFEAKKAWAWELPRPLAGYAVVELRGGRAHVAIPEEARGALREVGRALEELAARRPAAMLDRFGIDLNELLSLRNWLMEKEGVTSFTVYGLRGGAGTAIELHPPKPMGAEERRALWERVQNLLQDAVEPLVAEEEARALGEIGLGALAELAPQLRWWYDEREGSWKEGVLYLIIGEVYPPPPRQSKLDDVRIEGPRGVSRVDGEFVYAVLRNLDSELLPLAEEAALAAGELNSALERWHDLLGHLRWGERVRVNDAPLAEAAERGEARVWMEGGRVKVWLPPETAASVAERWGGDVRSYLRSLSELLDAGIELAGREEAPLVSPEVDEAHRRLVGVLRGLVGASP
jgi:hypothetical protein